MRGYAVVSAAKYLPELLGAVEAQRVINGFSPDTRRTVTAAKPAEWVPVSALSEVTRVVAAHANGDEDRARETLVACGRYMAHEASNTFLRLFLKLVSAQMLCKKVPELWARDFTGGKLEVLDLTENKVIYRTTDMERSFDHFPCTITGFVTFGLTTIGKTIENYKIHDWSLSRPCVSGASIELTWA